MQSSTPLSRCLLLGSILGLSAFLVGCGPSPDQKLTISGTITKGGKVLESDPHAVGAGVELKFSPFRGDKRPAPDPAEFSMGGGGFVMPNPADIEKQREGLGQQMTNTVKTTTTKDGQYSVQLLPGKYLISLRYYPKGLPMGTPGPQNMPKDELDGRFNMTNSEIIREFTASTSGVDIDLDKEKSKKNDQGSSNKKKK
jgi:hypothetical protein